MPTSRTDYILRMVEELGVALRALRDRLAGSLASAPAVQAQARRSQEELFGPLWPTLRSVDTATAAALVTSSPQLELWIGFIQLEADAARLAGNHVLAAQLAQRANQLAAALRARDEA